MAKRKLRPNPRQVALDLLQEVVRHKRTIDQGMSAHPQWRELDARDRGFAHLLVATTLRRLGEIDQALDSLVAEKLPAKANVVADALRLGACQLLFLGTPPHAAVSETVDLVENQGALAGYKGLVNAVLRRLDRERPKTDPWRNVPGWLGESWTAAYGASTARAIAAAHLEEAPLDLTLRGDPEIWRKRLGGELLPTGSLRLREMSGPVESLPGYEEGAWWVQDAAAALPARLLGNPRRAVDLCSAPGGKTLALAARGIEVTAVDQQVYRQGRLYENLRRLGLEADVITDNAATWRPKEPVEAVLLDAPCSATGTIRRHPDLPFRRRPDEIAKLAALQDRLLANAVAMTETGGVIVFATCSLQPEEGIERIEALLTSGAPIERIAIRPDEVGGLSELLTQAGDLRTLPCHLANQGGMDGFYAARLKRL